MFPSSSMMMMPQQQQQQQHQPQQNEFNKQDQQEQQHHRQQQQLNVSMPSTSSTPAAMPVMPTVSMPMSMPTTSQSSMPMSQPPQPQQMMMPGYNQLQQQPQIPMPSINGNSMSALIHNTYLTNGGVSNRISGLIPITEAKSQNEVIDEATIKMLREDFSKVSKMTLLDCEDSKYTLFIKQDAFEQQNYMTNLLSRMYRDKYKHLFDKYPGMWNWLMFCLTMLIYRSENELKLECQYSNQSNLQLGSHESFGILKRNYDRAFIRTSKNVKKPKTNLKHPLLEEKYFIQHESLFSIGSMVKYCIPTDFAIIHMTTSLSNVIKIITKTDKRVVMGLKGSFSKPILTTLEQRTVQQFKFYSGSNMDDVNDVISKMLDMPIEFNMFNIGTKEQKLFFNVTKETIPNSMSSNNNELKDDSCYFGLITNFQCVGKQTKQVDVRTYLNTLYEINKNLEMRSEQINAIDELIFKNLPELEERLNKYYDALAAEEEKEGGGEAEQEKDRVE
jgi:RNAse (barnase) inhibitor barstar